MSAVCFEVRDGVGTMTLNRPEALNALNPDMMDQMRRVVARVAEDDDISVLVISGGERAFSAGADLKYLSGVIDDYAQYFAFVDRFNAVLFEIEEAPVPTIAMVRGFVLAGGLELMLACDFAIAAVDARIGDQHANYGLMPGGGGTQRLVRRIGEQRGKELLFTGGWVDGARAQEIGLVLHAVPGERLEEETRALAGRMVTKSKKGLAYTKRAVRRGAGRELRHAVDQESHALFEYFTSSVSPMIGLQAFRDRKDPVFPE